MHAGPLLFFACLALGAEQSSQEHARQSYEYAREGNLPEAEREMRESIRLEPANPLFHSALAGILQRAGRLDECAAEYGNALESPALTETVRAQIASRMEQVYLQLGAELAKSARFGAGLVMATAASIHFPNSVSVFQMLGYFQTKRHMNIAAVKSYRRAVELDASSAESRVELGMAQSAAGLNVEAVRTLEEGIGKFPRDPMQYQALGVVLLQMSAAGLTDVQRARAMFEAALKLDSALPESNYQLGNLALQDGKLAEAKARFLTAAAAASSDSRIHFALARLYRRTGDGASAAREMQAFERTKAEATLP